MTFNYKYCNCPKDENQYQDYDFSETKIVQAQYVPAIIEMDKGNPYIEALPYPRPEEDIMDAYTRQLYDYDYDRVKTMSKIEKMLQVTTLRQLRFPLPFHKNLEFSLYNAIITSYRARKTQDTTDANVTFTAGNEEYETGCILYGDSAEATNAGFSLIGYSGCGKSSAINTLLSHYPQTIIHNIDDYSRYVQIVYLVVNCVPNSNFSALYEGIGHAIDKALGNVEPVYEKEISKVPTLGRKLDKVRDFIEKFGIGIIIFDEIQLINFEHSKESSFESLMTLANKTKVAIAVVGTEDARDKMFKELRTARRIGTVINGNHYCDNKKFFSFLVSELFQYQWFDKPIEMSNELVDALYNVSKGIVDQLIGIYSCMHYDYLERKNKPIIDAHYIYEIANKYYPGIQNVLAELESTEAARKLMSIRQDAEVRVANILDNAKQEMVSDELLKNQNTIQSKQLLLKNVIVNITGIYDEYSVPDIELAFHWVSKKYAKETKTEREISKLVLDRLEYMKKKSLREKKKETVDAGAIDVSIMRDFIKGTNTKDV